MIEQSLRPRQLKFDTKGMPLQIEVPEEPTLRRGILDGLLPAKQKVIGPLPERPAPRGREQMPEAPPFVPQR